MNAHTRLVRPIPLAGLSPTDFLLTLPDDFPIVYFGGPGRFAFLATSFSEIDASKFLQKPYQYSDSQGTNRLPFVSGYAGLIPYNEKGGGGSVDEAAMRVFRINESLVWDQWNQTSYLCGQRLPTDDFSLPSALLAQPSLRKANGPIDFARGLNLVELDDKEAYLRMSAAAIADIRAGRFYQINLLRYFDIVGQTGRTSLIQRIEKLGGPFSLYFEVPQLTVASLSPERFVEIAPRDKTIHILTQPIKGTAGRCDDPYEDRRRAEALAGSAKDNAELHIIVDLMRNDLNRICVRGSVQVLSPGKVCSYKTVHHLVAEIGGILRQDLNFGEIFESLLPGGSITGAPKIEVMKAIRAYEGRPRGYFMGIGFYLDDSGHFDSSILIRTLVARNQGPFQYAAGSGIVIASHPEIEYQEISEKCRVVSEPLSTQKE